MKTFVGEHTGLKGSEIPSDYLRWPTLQDRREERFHNLLTQAEKELPFRSLWNSHLNQD
jgi:hypothetical protein